MINTDEKDGINPSVTAAASAPTAPAPGDRPAGGGVFNLLPDVLRTTVREIGRTMNLDVPITPHTLRRSYTSELVKSNANLYHIKQLLGHESFETLNRYARLNIADLQKTHARCHPRERDAQ